MFYVNITCVNIDNKNAKAYFKEYCMLSIRADVAKVLWWFFYKQWRVHGLKAFVF